MPNVTFFEPGPAIQSLRESDFDTYSAFGEVIDNSLQADATQIRVKITVGGNKGRDIQSVAFADDGHGMALEALHNCLTIGWSSRYNNRSGIGRFGVGMTLGAIHECRRVQVWSRDKASANWLYTYLDLDEIAAKELADVPTPVKRVIPAEYDELVTTDHGTVVVWSKYDRQTDNANTVVESFRVWCGRTYRYFIWDAVAPRTSDCSIFINGEEVKAIDPLYVRTEKTRFPADTPAHLFEPMTIDWPVDRNAPGFMEGAKSTVTLRMSRLPENFRRRQQDGGRPPAKERFIDENNGISVLRNYREVFYGEVPYWKSGDGWSSFMDIDRWWGLEVLFDPSVDRAFQVKNIKRGAVPQRQLKMTIKDKIKGTRKTVLEQVRALWAETALKDREEEEKQEGEDLVRRAGQHDEAESAVKRAPVPKSQLDKDLDPEKEATKAAGAYGDRYDEEEKQKLAELFKSQPFSIMETTWPGQAFYVPKFLGGKAVLDYNTSHTFWQTVYGLVDELNEDDVDKADVARKIRVMLDLLIIAHAKAEAMFNADDEYTANEFVQYIGSHWGQYLASYVNSWNKEDSL